VQFIGFRDASVFPEDEISESGLTDIRVYSAGDRIRLYRRYSGSPTAPPPLPGEIEFFWLVPEAGGTSLAGCAILRARPRTRP
jgi:hypothetical protein